MSNDVYAEQANTKELIGETRDDVKVRKKVIGETRNDVEVCKKVIGKIRYDVKVSKKMIGEDLRWRRDAQEGDWPREQWRHAAIALRDGEAHGSWQV